jgi:hypothetical protein
MTVRSKKFTTALIIGGGGTVWLMSWNFQMEFHRVTRILMRMICNVIATLNNVVGGKKEKYEPLNKSARSLKASK